MAREQIPISPNIVTWARERAGFSINEAEQKFREIRDWEAGVSFPSYPQLEQLAETFKIPIAVFFFPEPPRLPPLIESFRTLPDAEFSRIPRRVRFLLRKGKALQLNLQELCGGRNPAARLITRDVGFRAGQIPQAMAGAVREYLGITLDQQSAWPSDDDAVKNWRKALLDVGIFVFKDAFGNPEYSGFCLYDHEFPIIYVNNSMARTRQIFTMFHELAHLLFNTSGIDTITDDYIPTLPAVPRQIEILCNQFATEFLLPEAAFEIAFNRQAPTEQTAERLARQFHVSREVIFRRFLDRELIDEATYTSAAIRWASQRQAGDGGNHYWTKISYLGREYIELALSQYHQNRIDQEKLAEYLDSKPRYVNALEEYIARGGA